MSEENKTNEVAEKKDYQSSYQTIGLGVTTAVVALWGYFRFFGMPAKSDVVAAEETPKEPKKHADILALSTASFKYLDSKHPMYKNMEEIQTRIYDTDKWQLRQFADAVKLLDAFEGLLVSCPAKKHSETVRYPEMAFNIQRNFMDKVKLIAQAQRKDDTHVRANVVMEFAELVNTWMTDNIGNLNLINDEKVAASIIGV